MTRPATRQVDAPCCEGPGYDGKPCGRPSRYSREVDGKEASLCDAHNMQLHRAWKAGKELVLYPLQVRKVVRQVQPCEGPAGGKRKCTHPGWNLHPLKNQRLCDAHLKQIWRNGQLVDGGKLRPVKRKEEP